MTTKHYTAGDSERVERLLDWHCGPLNGAQVDVSEYILDAVAPRIASKALRELHAELTASKSVFRNDSGWLAALRRIAHRAEEVEAGR